MIFLRVIMRQWCNALLSNGTHFCTFNGGTQCHTLLYLRCWHPMAHTSVPSMLDEEKKSAQTETFSHQPTPARSHRYTPGADLRQGITQENPLSLKFSSYAWPSVQNSISSRTEHPLKYFFTQTKFEIFFYQDFKIVGRFYFVPT